MEGRKKAQEPQEGPLEVSCLITMNVSILRPRPRVQIPIFCAFCAFLRRFPSPPTAFGLWSLPSQILTKITMQNKTPVSSNYLIFSGKIALNPPIYDA